MKRTAILFASLLSALLAPTGSAGSRVDYAAYAGDPVPEIRFSQLYNWQRTSDKSMAIWTRPSAAYLLTFRNNCDALSGRYAVEVGGVDGITGRLKAGSDDVIVGQLRCRIVAIQPIDLKQLKQDRMASR